MKISIARCLLVIGLLLVAAVRPTFANLIVNGDFETGTFAGWTTIPAGTGSNFGVGPVPPAHDTLGAYFGATGPDFDAIRQTFATTPGAFYDLSFFYQVVEPGAPPDNGFRVLFNGVVIFENLNAISGFGTFPFNHLQATGGTTTLEFQGRNVEGFDYLDDVSVTNAASLNPSKDNTLYEFDPAEGDVSNALGNHFFTGVTAMAEIRRGVLAFDIAGSIQPGSTITGVSLSMNVSRVFNDTARTTELHKLLADWGEGTSQAPGEEGDGAPATTNDATWRHRFFDTIFWTTQGGDFSNTVSASQSVGAIGEYTWSSAQMVADVQSWLDNPANNFGWLVLGDESGSGTAKRFDTRESASPPVLTIEYTPGPTPTPTPSVTPRPRPTPGPSATPHASRPPRPVGS
jgi:hypothetical protein